MSLLELAGVPPESMMSTQAAATAVLASGLTAGSNTKSASLKSRLEEATSRGDFKTALNLTAQTLGWKVQYTTDGIGEQGSFQSSVLLNDLSFFQGSARIGRKRAEQSAAELGLAFARQSLD